ncbi:MAG TPA: hypothetical protein VJ939_05780 [Bacteroidales bacterium]|nr:hypothetical protein [Bacteroidales bacterium]
MKINILIVALVMLFAACNTSSTEGENEKKSEKKATEIKQSTSQTEFGNTIKMKCLEKTYTKHDNQDYIHYKFSISNISDDDVEAIRGKIVFTNKEGEEIKSFVMAYQEPIKAHEEAIWEAETIFDQFMDNENALKAIDVKKLNCQWEPIEIVFSNGETMTSF